MSAKKIPLCRRAENQGFRVGKHGSEVGHCADADKNQTGIHAGFDADVKNIHQSPGAKNRAVVDVFARPEVGVIHFIAHAGGNVGQQHTKGDTDQKERLELLFDAEIQQKASDDEHDEGLPTFPLEDLRNPRLLV